MSFPTRIVKAVQEYVQGIEGWPEIEALADAANTDLYSGPGAVSEDTYYIGFTAACRDIAQWLADNAACLYVGEDSEFVSDRAPEGCEWSDPNEEDEGAVWCEPEPFYALDMHDIACILFGVKLARYL